MSPVASPDVVEVFRTFLIDRAAGTGIEGVEIRGSNRDPGDEPPLLLLAEGGANRDRSVGAFLPARVNVSALGANEGAAAALMRAVSDVAHRAGPIHVGTAGIWRIYDETGMQRPVQEPDTEWWRAFGVFDLYMADRAV